MEDFHRPPKKWNEVKGVVMLEDALPIIGLKPDPERKRNVFFRFFRLPFEILKVLQKIDARLEKIEAVQNELRQCIDKTNHQQRPAIRTGHWND